LIQVTYKDHMGSDLSVVNAARVSFGKEKEALGYTKIGDGPSIPVIHDTDKNLIKYLAKHKHMSPFGHSFASFHIKAPMFVARQLVKHKFLRWNEISRRYVDDEPEFYVPDTWRGRSADKKQGSDGVVTLGKLDQCIVDDYPYMALTAYRALLDAKVAPEMARMTLPASAMTEWYWSGSLDAFSDMCNLRCKSDTQAETREVANQIDRKMIDLFPVSWDALTDEGDI
jgi:thymidylate synthase (FAD)